MPILMPPYRTPKHYWNAIAKIITLFIFLLILIGTLSPASELPDVNTGDKAVHLIAFTLLALPLNMVVRQRWFLLNITFIIFGGAIEVIQPLIGRNGEWLDFGADTLGVLAAVMVVWGFRTVIDWDD